MNEKWYQSWIRCAAAFALATAASGAAAEGSLGKEVYEAAVERIEAQAKAEKAGCKSRKGLAQDLCKAEVKGRERIALAQLHAQYEPGPEADRLVKNAKAEAAYDLARLRCDAGRDAARKACIRQAKLTREAAIRLAKVEKVEAIREAKREQRQAQRQSAPRS